MSSSHFTEHAVCPVCNSNSTAPLFDVIDHSVSGEVFPVWCCNACAVAFTVGVPDIEHIGPYYQSDVYISHSETKKGLVNKLYHLVRKITLKQKVKLVENVSGLNKGKLLDIGSGTGAFASAMKEAGWKVVALEPDEAARNNARAIHGVHALSGEQIYTVSEQFDVITLWHVLEHVHDLQGYVNRFVQMLKPGGRLIIAVPNYTSKDAAIYGTDWAAWDVPRHLYHFSPDSIKQLMNRNGMEVKEMKPMWFDSFYVSMLSEQYRKGSMIRGVVNGLRSNIHALGNTSRCSSVIYVIGKQS
jgi:2-polyprenyl-3-methyl-5-hydroxy-6-metoxy-1,4-benzoquinol methylase